MNTDQLIDKTLTASEFFLLSIPKKRFDYDSWTINDRFMKFSVDLVLITYLNLINREYIKVEETTTPLKLFGFISFTKRMYKLTLLKKVSEIDNMGWLEGLFFKYMENKHQVVFTDIIYVIFKETFEGQSRMTNPGKRFLLEVLKHQRLNLFHVEHVQKLFSYVVKISQNTNHRLDLQEPLFHLNTIRLEERQLNSLRMQIKSQLEKFQDLD